MNRGSLLSGINSFRPSHGYRVRRLVALALATGCVALLAGAVGATAARETTAPDVASVVPVSLTNDRIQISIDQFTRHGVTIYPRGALIDFFLVNRGTKPVTVRIKLLSKLSFYAHRYIATYTSAGHQIDPGMARHFKIDFFFRSRFAMQMLVGGKVQASVPIEIV